MDPALGSGDRYLPVSPRSECKETKQDEHFNEDVEKVSNLENVTPETMDDHENKLKHRIAQCRNIIESLKFELNEEKAKLKKDIDNEHPQIETTTNDLNAGLTSGSCNFSNSRDNNIIDSLNDINVDMYSACVDSKLNCDENLMEYEKQLEKYQTTLSMAHIEKKNAIRKQMLAKAYKLKLLELENQCNIELLRVKQSLQCLEPLQMIASNWKTSPDEGSYNLDTFELMPCYPEISSFSGAEIDQVEGMKDEPKQSSSD